MQTPLALIIEDDRDLVEIYSIALQRAGYEIEACISGDQAQTRLAETIPALIVLDLQLPGVSGMDLFAMIRQDTRLSETRVIIATASPGRIEHQREEVDLILVKPISVNQLRDLAARLKPG